MFHSIHSRVSFAFILLTVGVLLAFGAYVSVLIHDSHLASVEDTMAREAILIADAAAAQLQGTGEAPNLKPLAISAARGTGARVTLIARNGTIFADSEGDPPLVSSYDTRPEFIQAMRLEPGGGRHSASTSDDTFTVAVPIASGDRVFGVAEVSTPIAGLGEPIPQLTLAILAATIVTTGLAILLAGHMGRQTTEAIKRLARMANRLAAGHTVEPVVVDAADEIAALAETFNNMAATLRRKIDDIEEQRVESAAVLDGMGDGVVIVDEALRVVAVNRAAEQMLEVSAVVARGASITEVVRHHDVVGLLDLGKRSEGPLVVEIGRDRHQVQVVVTPVHVGDSIRQVILFQDVTELRRAETIRRDFVANVSHELRTPLAALLLLVETLENGALEDPTVAKEFLGRMHGEVDRLNQMVEELLELARIESGRVRYQYRRANLATVVGEAVERMRPQADRQNIRLELNVPTDSVDALVDPDRLHQVIVNLVHNAVKFTPSGGSIQVSVVPGESQHEISIADTGVGVSADALSRLFERFYKVDRSRASPGTGLGLAIVKHLVLAHGGKVWAESPGRGLGTTFHIALPAGVGPRRRGPAPGFRVTANLRPGATSHEVGLTEG